MPLPVLAPRTAAAVRTLPVILALTLLGMPRAGAVAGEVQSLKEARKIALEALDQIKPPMDFKIHDKETIEKDYGWVFFYSPKGKGDSHAWGLDAVGGGPLVIERATGDWYFLGTTVSPEVAIETFEKRLRRAQEGGH